MVMIVGREQELTTLRNALDASLQRRGSLVLISGEAGIGKTAVVQELVLEARARDVLVLVGHCYDLSITPPYGPWLELTDRYMQEGDAPELPAVLKRGTGTGDLISQVSLFDVAREFFLTVSLTQPLILVLEDIHWSDQASLDMLRYIARGISEQSVLIVATHRDDEVTSENRLYGLLPALIRESGATRLKILPLSKDALQELIRQRYRLPAIDESRLSEYLLSHSEGNPLYAGELLRMLEERSHLQQDGRIWKLESIPRSGVPTLIDQIINGRLDRLNIRTRELLRIAAAIGPEVPLDLWQSLAGATDREFDLAIREAIDAHQLNEWKENSSVRFAHALIRESLYASLGSTERRRLHQRVAEALSDSPHSDPDEVAFHFRQAGDPRASEWLIRAGNRASRTFASLAAVQRFEEALQMNDGVPFRQNESGWLSLKIAIESRELDPLAARARIEQAMTLAEMTGDQALRASTLFHSGQNRLITGENGFSELETGLRELQSLPAHALEMVHKQFPEFDSGLLDAAQALMRTLFGHYEAAIPIARECILSTVHENRFTNNERGHAWLALALSYRALGQPDASRDAFARVRHHYSRAGNVWMGAIAGSLELLELVLIYYPDDHEMRRATMNNAEDLWTRSSGFATSLPPQFGLISAMLADGRWDEARRFSEPYAKRDVIHHNVAIRILGTIAKRQGDTDLAWKLVNLGIPNGPDTAPDSTWLVDILEMQRLAVELSNDEGNTHLARRWLTAHDEWLNWSKRVQGRSESLRLWGEIYRAEGNSEKALEYATESLSQAQNPRQPIAVIEAQRFLGELAFSSGDIDRARQHLNESLELADACALPFERALALLAIAELEVTRRPESADCKLSEAIQICTKLGARPTLERAARLTSKDSMARSDHDFGLTPRELSVLRLVAEGMTDREIAEQLYISHNTVMRHVSHILAKLGVDSRTRATALAIRDSIV